jgi:hypothetical protein
MKNKWAKLEAEVKTFYASNEYLKTVKLEKKVGAVWIFQLISIFSQFGLLLSHNPIKFKGVFSKPSGKSIVALIFCFLS